MIEIKQYHQKLYLLSLYMDIWITERWWREQMFIVYWETGFIIPKDSYVDDFETWYLNQINK